MWLAVGYAQTSANPGATVKLQLLRVSVLFCEVVELVVRGGWNTTHNDNR